MPHLGHCYISQPPDPMQLGCRMGVSFQAMSVHVGEDTGPSLDIASFSNPSLPSGFSPTTDASSGTVNELKPNTTFDFIPRHEIATFDTTLSIRNVRLSDYLLSR